MSSRTEKLKAKIEKLRAEQRAIWDEIRPKQDRLHEIYEALRDLQEQRDKAETAGDAEPDWPELIRRLASDGESSVTLLRFAEKHLRGKFDMYHSGFWSDTREASFKLKVERTDESERKSLAGLKFFTPLYKPHEDGYVWFELFEHTLSEHGIYKLKVKPDLTDLHLTFARYSRESVEKRFKTPEEAVQYIRIYHYYGDGPDRDYEDDEN